MFVSGGAIALFQRVILLISGEAAVLAKNIKKMENALFVPRFSGVLVPVRFDWFSTVGFVLMNANRMLGEQQLCLLFVRLREKLRGFPVFFLLDCSLGDGNGAKLALP